MNERTLRKRNKIGSELIFLPIVIIALCIISGVINPRFFTGSNFLVIFQQVAVLGILTSAMLMLLVMGAIDLSYGSLIGLCSVLLCNMISEQGVDPMLALLTMFAVAIGGGALNGFIVTKFDSYDWNGVYISGICPGYFTRYVPVYRRCFPVYRNW